MNIHSIIKCLDEYIERNNIGELNPVDANHLLAKKGLLSDSDSRPGKPLRNLLRDGKLPHAYQPGGKGSGWVIPHSGLKSNPSDELEKSATENLERKKSTSKPETFSLSVSDIEMKLMNENHFQSVGEIDRSVPHNPGLYSLRVRSIDKLPAPFDKHLAERGHNIIYIGIASKSLNRRMLNQELRANGHGTFFRSTGAMLGYRPPKGSLIHRKNKRNYKFSSSDEQKIIEWMNANLLVNWIEVSGGLSSIETELVIKYQPLLNIAKNPAALPILSQLRKECVDIANSR